MSRTGKPGPENAGLSFGDIRDAVYYLCDGLEYVQPKRKGALNPKTGESYPSVNEGVYNPRTGEYYPPTSGGYFNPRTGEFHPS